MNAIKIECPFCQQPMELPDEDARRGLNCPGCFRFLTPELLALPIPPRNAPVNDVKRERDANLRQYQIRNRADVMSVVAIVCFVIGAILFLFCLLSPEEPGRGWWLSLAVFLGLGVWLYLIAQIIHIRANTEK